MKYSKMKSQNYFKHGVNRKVWSIYLLKPLPFEANTFIHQKVQTCASFAKQKCSQNYFTAKTTPPYQPPCNHARISGNSNFYWNWVANVYLADRGRKGGAGGGYAGASGRSARSSRLVYRATGSRTHQLLAISLPIRDADSTSGITLKSGKIVLCRSSCSQERSENTTQTLRSEKQLQT